MSATCYNTWQHDRMIPHGKIETNAMIHMMMSTCQQLQLQLMMNTCTANDTHDDVNMSTTSTNDEYMHGWGAPDLFSGSLRAFGH